MVVQDKEVTWITFVIMVDVYISRISVFSELNSGFENMNSLPQDNRDLVKNLVKIHVI